MIRKFRKSRNGKYATFSIYIDRMGVFVKDGADFRLFLRFLNLKAENSERRPVSDRNPVENACISRVRNL